MADPASALVLPATPLAEGALTEPSRVTAPLRIGINDPDAGFVAVLARRLDELRWGHVTLKGRVPPEQLITMRLDALLVDHLPHLGARSWTYLAEITQRLPTLLVVVCTRRSDVAARIRGLRLGAIDWITKPCHPDELIARVQTAHRLQAVSAAADTRPVLVAGEIEIRREQLQVFARDQSAELTRLEFELILVLAGAGGRVLGRDEIYRRVWGDTRPIATRSVDVLVQKVRRKLKHASQDWTYVHTRYGAGYWFSPKRQ